MQIIISNKMRSMPTLSLYMLTQMDNNNIAKFEQNDISLDILSAAKDEAIKSLVEPHFFTGKNNIKIVLILVRIMTRICI